MKIGYFVDVIILYVWALLKNKCTYHLDLFSNDSVFEEKHESFVVFVPVDVSHGSFIILFLADEQLYTRTKLLKGGEAIKRIVVS